MCTICQWELNNMKISFLYPRGYIHVYICTYLNQDILWLPESAILAEVSPNIVHAGILATEQTKLTGEGSKISTCNFH